MSKYAHKTLFKGQELDIELACQIFIANANEQDKFWMTYEITDTTNQHKYYGKTCVKTPNKLLSYTGSGSILKFFQKRHGLNNFVVQIKGLFQSDIDARLEEARVVNYDYIHRNDTYNTTLGGTTHPTIETDTYYIEPHSSSQFSGYKSQSEKFAKFGMIRGLTPENCKKTGFGSPEGRKTISRLNSKVKLITPMGEITVSTTNVRNYIMQDENITFKSTRVWMHKPGETTYVRGINWTQPLTTNVKRLRRMCQEGWDFGIPSNYR